MGRELAKKISHITVEQCKVGEKTLWAKIWGLGTVQDPNAKYENDEIVPIYHTPGNGIYYFALVADNVGETVPPDTYMQATYFWPSPPPDFRGARIYGKENYLEVEADKISGAHIAGTECTDVTPTDWINKIGKA